MNAHVLPWNPSMMRDLLSVLDHQRISWPRPGPPSRGHVAGKAETSDESGGRTTLVACAL